MSYILFVLFELVVAQITFSTMIKMGEMIVRDNFQWKGEISMERKLQDKHTVIIAVKQKNLDLLEEILYERSDPKSPFYQQWLTFEQVHEYIANKPAETAIKAWIHTLPHAKIIWESPRKEYLKVIAPIYVWEEALQTTFYEWSEEDPINKEKLKKYTKSNRFKGHDIIPTHIFAKEYFIPDYLVEHITTIFNTVQTPPIVYSGGAKYQNQNQNQYHPPTFSQSSDLRLLVSQDAVTLSFIQSYYKVSRTQGSSALSQLVFETNSEFYSSDDLEIFQSQFGLSLQSAIDVHGDNIDDYSNVLCNNPYSQFNSHDIVVDCNEGNLDLQYIMGLAPNTKTYYWYIDSSVYSNPFLQWIMEVSNSTQPPSVNSLSWGSNEQDNDPSVLTIFNTEAMKLGLIGVSVFVSSGDDGVASRNSTDGCRCNQNSGSSKQSAVWTGTNTWTGKGYFPSFPATSPFVTAVGATMGPNRGNAEVTCQSNLGGIITSGGGFSTYFKQPQYQKQAVTTYFNKTSLHSKSPYSSGYNAMGRGYPDISIIGVNYPTYIDGYLIYLSGTSASTPVFASFISLINAIRHENGLGTVGFLNPTLYASGYNITSSNVSYYNDIVSGSNHCCSNNKYPGTPTVCCKSGFNSTELWDPVTGWGSIDFPSLATMFGVNSSITAYENTNSDSTNMVLSTKSKLYIISGIAAGITFISAIVFYFVYLGEVKAQTNKEVSDWSPIPPIGISPALAQMDDPDIHGLDHHRQTMNSSFRNGQSNQNAIVRPVSIEAFQSVSAIEMEEHQYSNHNYY